jgi:hypothetical protein
MPGFFQDAVNRADRACCRELDSRNYALPSFMVEILDEEHGTAGMLYGNWIGKKSYSWIWQFLPAGAV